MFDYATYYKHLEGTFWWRFKQRWSYTVQEVGLDKDDLFQDYLLSFVSRQQGTNPWDPAKSSIVCYTRLVVDSVVGNKVRDARRPRNSFLVLTSAGDLPDATATGPGLTPREATEFLGGLPGGLQGVSSKLSRLDRREALNELNSKLLSERLNKLAADRRENGTPWISSKKGS